MADPKYYLKQNVQIDPLFNHWYAYPQLISPATAAMHIANSHLKIESSCRSRRVLLRSSELIGCVR